MNYRHIYHAGNFADVFKHIALILCVEYLKQKDKPFFLLDTHAGIGRYDLTSDEARRTGEAEEGIRKLFTQKDLPETIRHYLTLVKIFNPEGVLRIYPGSPLLMKRLLRPGDRMIANELHPEDNRALRHVMGGDDRIKVEKMDGYAALKAFLPPPERRGLVLVDPPFEVRDEFGQMAEGLKQAHKRWATGVYILWYPIKDPAHVAEFHASLKAADIPDCQALDFYLHPVRDPDTLNGCGLALVNAPWTLKDQMQKIMPALIEYLTGGHGSLSVTEISAEK